MTTDTKQRIPLADAERLAGELVRFLGRVCERIEVAGSIRRQRPEVGDIELVAVPKLVAAPGQVDLFGVQVAQGKPVDMLDMLARSWIDGGAFGLRLDVNGRSAVGEKYKRLTYEGVGLDLFSVVPGGTAQFGVIFTIRTGSAEFSHRLVTPRLEGGWLPSGQRVRDGAIWDGATVLDTPDEAAVFAIIGAPYLAPEKRTDTVQLIRVKGQESQWVDRAAVQRGVPA